MLSRWVNLPAYEMSFKKIVAWIKGKVFSTIHTAIWLIAWILERIIYGFGEPFYGKTGQDLLEIDGFVRRRRRVTAEQELRMVCPERVFDILQFGKQISDNGPCVGYRPSKDVPYIYLTYEELMQRARNFGAGLLMLGGRTDADFLVGIFAKTCLEWTIAEYGILAYGMVTAPLYDSLGQEACFEVTEFCEIEIMICGGDAQITALMGSGRIPSKLRTIVSIDLLSTDRMVELSSLGVRVLTMEAVENLGRSNPRPVHQSKPDDLATLILTSGTTGMPKSVMITHRQLILAVKSLLSSFLPVKFTPDDTILGFLPLSHIFEREAEKMIHLSGGKVAYVSGDASSLSRAAKEVKPTFFLFVPRLMTRLYDQIQQDLNGSAWRYLLSRIGFAFKKLEMQAGTFRNDSIWDKLIFKKYQNILGGKVGAGISGGAAADPEILNFIYIRTVFGCYVFDGYGQSEACGPISLTAYGDMSKDNVGVPFSGVEIKLADVPDMGYFAADGRGEVCTRSPFTMKGYLKMPEKTVETIDGDGFVHTGDIGMWLSNGNLRIFDRKKHIFKLNQGEYLAPERLEGVFGRSELITNIFIDGDSRYPFCVGLVYPNYDALKTSIPSPEDKKSLQKVTECIMDDLLRIGKEANLKSYEIPKKICLLDEPFSVENGCVTPSQKTRREGVRMKFKDKIRGMYMEDE